MKSAAAALVLAAALKAAAAAGAGAPAQDPRMQGRAPARAAAPASGGVFIAAQDPRVRWQGRTELLADGASVRFDWPAVAAYLTVNNTGQVSLNVTSQTTGLNRVITQLFIGGYAYEQTRQWVAPGDSTLSVAQNIYGETSLRVFFELEPAFNGAGADAGYVVHGFALDAGDAVQQAPRSHSLEIVGDSISAGYGALGQGGGCPVMDYTSGNFGTYNRQICDFFDAECSVIAWSGKGMYANCCDNGETMPSYFLQTRGGEDYSTSWDFSRFTPDAMVINLGTNDFNHDNGTAWEAAFSSTYASFVLNATARYNKPRMPVFLAQGNMNDGAPLHDALQVAAAAVNAAGGNAHYLDLRTGPTDGCGNHPGVLGHAAMFAASKATIASVMGWSWRYGAGFLAAGNDAAPPLTSTTLADAEAACLGLDACVGVTFAGDDPSPAGPIPLVYLKNASGLSPAAGWQTYLALARL